MKKDRKNNREVQSGRHEHPLPHEISKSEREKSQNALEQASHDIDEDPEFSAKSPNDDLDEGETARLGEGPNELI